MSKITFKLNEGVIGNIVGDVIKHTGKELLKIAISPLLGGYEETEAVIKKVTDEIRRRDYYSAKQFVKQNTENLIGGYVEFLKKVETLAQRKSGLMVGFRKEKFNDDELELMESFLKSFIEKKEKEYTTEIKNAYSFKSEPPQFDSKTKLLKEFNKEIKQLIKSKYNGSNDKYYRLNTWYDSNMKVVGTSFPNLVAAGIINLSEQWLELEKKAKRI